MQRLVYLACCAGLALGLATPALAGALGSAAADAFRRLPQSAPSAPPAANGAATAAQPASTAPTAPTASTTPASPAAPAGPSDAGAPAAPVLVDLPPASSDPLAPDPARHGAHAGLDSSSGFYITGGPGGLRVPEPGALWLLGIGGVGLALALARGRRNSKKKAGATPA